MGRIKTNMIKRVSRELIEKHRSELTTDFEKNKKVVAEKLNFVPSKRVRNIIAGYVTRLAKRKAE
ncbi:MAG: 30S ribosomal protein S17e [Candidatus Woesearchaeota archaeon]